MNVQACFQAIPINEIILDKEQRLEAYVKKVFKKETIQGLFDAYGTTKKLELLHQIGLEKQLYTGDYQDNQLSPMRMNAKSTIPSNNRYIIANGLTHDITGRMTKKGNLVGKCNVKLDNFESPYENSKHGFQVNALGGGFVCHAKAMGILWGEEILDKIKAFDQNGNEITDLKSQILASPKFRQNEPDAFKAKIRYGKYVNNAGSFIVDSVSKFHSIEHVVSIMQPGMLVNNSFYLPENTRYSNTARDKSLRIDVQHEFGRAELQNFDNGDKSNHELSKHEIACLEAMIMGKDFCKAHGHFLQNPNKELKIEIPKRKEPKSSTKKLNYYHDHLNFLKLPDDIKGSSFNPGDVLKLLALYLNDLNGATMQYAIGTAYKLYYLDEFNEAFVDHAMLSNLGEYLLKPELHWKYVMNQEIMKRRFKRSCYDTGAAMLNPPTPLIGFVDMPAGSAVEDNVLLTWGSRRRKELIKCNNNKCIDYSSYNGVNHRCKHEDSFYLDHLEKWKNNPSFFKHPSKYIDYNKKKKGEDNIRKKCSACKDWMHEEECKQQLTMADFF